MRDAPLNVSAVATVAAADKIVRDVVHAYVRMHVLHHAAEEALYGLEMIEELGRHGYDMGPGTLYPLLHSLEEAGFLRSRRVLVAGKNRRYYRTTKAGDKLLALLRARVGELVDEVVVGGGAQPATSGRRPRAPRAARTRPARR